MIAPNDFLSRACGVHRCNHGVDGNAMGRWAEFVWTSIEEGSAIRADWEIELFGNLPRDAAAVFVFRDGVFLERLSLRDFIVFHPEQNDDPFFVEFLLAENDEVYSRWPFAVQKDMRARAHLSWRIAVGSGGIVEAVRVYQSAYGGTAIDESAAVKTFQGSYLSLDPVGSEAGGTSGNEMTVSGKYSGSDRTATITVAVTTAGGPGAGVVTYTQGSNTGTLTIENRAQYLYRGILVSFEDATYQVGDTWTIRWGPAQEWTTRRLRHGTHAWKITTENPLGIESDLDALSAATLAVKAMPGDTEADGYDYTDGSGVATLRFLAAAESGVSVARLYRNFPDEGIDDLWYVPVETRSISPGALLIFTVTGLQAGLNRFCCRVSNDWDDEENVNLIEILLDANLDEYTLPLAVDAVQAEMGADGLVAVTILGADESSDTINLYGNGGGGAVDYGTVLLAIDNPQAGDNQTLTGTVYLADGTHTLAARAMSGTIEETNTDVTTTVTVNTQTANQATALAVELV